MGGGGSGGIVAGSGGGLSGSGGLSDSGAGGGLSGSGAGGLSGSGGAGGSSGSGGAGGSSGSGGTGDCSNILEATYRDFSDAHPDFEMAFSGDVVRLQLIESMLGSDRKPVFRSSVGCAPAEDDPTVCHASYFPDQPVVTSADTFGQWYRDAPGVNIDLQRTLELTDNGSGQYVYDSSMFFPLGADEGFGITPATTRR